MNIKHLSVLCMLFIFTMKAIAANVSNCVQVMVPVQVKEISSTGSVGSVDYGYTYTVTLVPADLCFTYDVPSLPEGNLSVVLNSNTSAAGIVSNIQFGEDQKALEKELCQNTAQANYEICMNSAPLEAEKQRLMGNCESIKVYLGALGKYSDAAKAILHAYGECTRNAQLQSEAFEKNMCTLAKRESLDECSKNFYN